jgi:hypothetical protein
MQIGGLNGRLIVGAGQFNSPQHIGVPTKKIQSIDAHSPTTPNRRKA